MVLRQAWRNLLASRLRLALTSLAVVLGVGFVTGAFVLGDTITKAFDDIFATANQGVAVDVRGVKTVSDADRQPVPATILARVRAVEGVRTADGVVQGTAQIINAKGDAVGGGGPPTLGFNWTGDERTNPLRVVAGRPPTAPDEVVVDAQTARAQNLSACDGGAECTPADGRAVKIIATPGGTATYRISGIVNYGDSQSLGGATLVAFTTPTAQRIFDLEGRYSTIAVSAQDGVSQATLAARVARALPTGYEAVTGETATQEASDQFGTLVGIIRDFLLVFAFIALFVGSFIIFNAFVITVAQRTRQVGLLRAVGASQRQVVGSVIVEALIIGLVASVVGVLFGIAVAWLLQALFDAFGAKLPSTTLQVRPRTVIVGIVVGLLVTVVSAVGPARRASRVPPIAALRDIHVVGTRRKRAIASAVMAVLGVALVLFGTLSSGEAGPRLAALAVGSILLFVGSAMLTQYVARPLAAAIGAPFARIGGTSARLGRENAMRNPRRTAQTAAALTIGVALVAGVTVFAASLYSTFAGALDERIRADVVAEADGQPFTPAAASVLRGVPELGAVTAWRTGEFKDPDGGTQEVQGVDPVAITRMYDPEVLSGSLADLARDDSIAVSRVYADDHDLAVGDAFPALFSRTGVQRLTVRAVFKDRTFGEFFISLGQYERSFTTQQDTVVLAVARPGVDQERAKAAAAAALDRDYPNLNVYTKDGYKDFVGTQINQFLLFFYVLLAMAVVIAVFGIVLTLALSVFERTREIGLLRAVGMSQRGVRTMVRWEAIIVALIGAAVGLPLGVFLGVVGVRAVPDLDTVSIPWVRLVIFLVLAAVLGVLAAILPARRAAKLDVLQAISAE